MLTLVSVIFVFGLLVTIHEYGHFLVAKAMGVRVEKFSIGFGPTIATMRRGDTEYMLCALPLGGYVKLGGDEAGAELQKERWEFLSRSPWERNLIVLAGPLMNLFLAFVLLSLISMVGIPMFTSRVGEVKKGMPADVAGLKANDVIVAINGKPTKLWDDLVGVIYANPGKEIELTVRKSKTTAAAEETTKISIKPKEEVMKDLFGKEHRIGIIGITPATEMTAEKMSLIPAVGAGFRATLNMTGMTYKGLWLLVTRQVPANSIGGPLMIAKLAGESARKGIVQLLYFTAVISVSLAAINLLPIPVLDGGHLLFFTIEGVRGKPVSLQAQEWSYRAGLGFLVALMLFATYNDVVRFFS